MDKKTIEDLPDEVLLHIFELLDGSELKLCCLTQSRWNNVIGSSHVTMKKFFLKLSDSLFTEITQQLTRNYHSLWINSPPTEVLSFKEISYITISFKKFLQVYGAKLKTIKLNLVSVYQFETLAELCPLLETLELSKSNLFDTDSLKIPELKHLKLFDCVCETLFSSLNNLVSLEFSKVDSKKHILQLLMRQSSLQFLKIKGFPELFSDDAHQTLHQVSFRLKKLEIDGEYTESIDRNRNNHINFEAFLKLHRNTLESFSVTGRNLTSNVAELLFASPFKSLKSLEFSVENLSLEKSFYYAMPTLHNVKVLKLRGLFRKADVSKIFMSKFTELEALYIEEMTTSSMSSKFLKTIAAYQQKLEVLSIKNLFKGTPINLHFKNLRSFKTFSIHDTSIWLNFVLTHLTLEEITVYKLERMVTAENFESLLELPNLKRINFRGTFGVIKRMFEVLKGDYKNLKTANLEIDQGPAFPIDQRIHQIKIDFPSDVKFWNPQKYDDKFVEIAKIIKVII